MNLIHRSMLDKLKPELKLIMAEISEIMANPESYLRNNHWEIPTSDHYDQLRSEDKKQLTEIVDLWLRAYGYTLQNSKQCGILWNILAASSSAPAENGDDDIQSQ